MEYAIAIVGAFLAGCINTLSGNGSAITLTILMELLGLPADVANGTNRVGVFTQGLAGSWAFKRGGRFDEISGARRREQWRIVAILTVGAVVGVWLSLIISNEAYRRIFRYLLVVMLVVILVKPKRWLVVRPESPPLSLWVAVPLFFLLGIYGGFIQMGMGVIFLAVMVLVARYEIIQANVVKVLAVTVYTGIAIAIFAWRGVIDWEIGLVMAVGQTLGGFLTARFAVRDPRAATVTYWLLVVVVIGAIVKAFWP